MNGTVQLLLYSHENYQKNIKKNGVIARAVFTGSPAMLILYMYHVCKIYLYIYIYVYNIV